MFIRAHLFSSPLLSSRDQREARRIGERTRRFEAARERERQGDARTQSLAITGHEMLSQNTVFVETIVKSTSVLCWKIVKSVSKICKNKIKQLDKIQKY